MDNGVISIIIPTYNRAHLIPKTLDSIINQSYQNWECIIIDDKSTDNTGKIIEEYLKDSRFKYAKNTRTKGAPGARNTGLEMALGEFIFFFDSDNLMKENALEELHKGISESNAEVCSCFAEVYNDHNEIINTFKWINIGNISEQILSGESYVDYNLALIRHDAIKRFGITDENCPSYQEWDTHIRLSEFCTYHTVEEILIEYYQRSEDTISSDLKRSVEGYFYILNKHQNLFSRDNQIFKKQAWMLMQTAEKINDPAFKKELKNKLTTLVSGFQTYLLTQKFRNLFTH